MAETQIVEIDDRRCEAMVAAILTFLSTQGVNVSELIAVATGVLGEGVWYAADEEKAGRLKAGSCATGIGELQEVLAALVAEPDVGRWKDMWQQHSQASKAVHRQLTSGPGAH